MNVIAGKLFGLVVEPGQTGVPRLPVCSIDARKCVSAQLARNAAYYRSGM